MPSGQESVSAIAAEPALPLLRRFRSLGHRLLSSRAAAPASIDEFDDRGLGEGGRRFHSTWRPHFQPDADLSGIVSEEFLFGRSSTSAGGVFPTCIGVRPLVADALAPADGEEKLRAMLQESLAVATRTQAMKPSERSVWKDPLGGAGMSLRKAHRRGRRK
jgi:hypothetical protein